MLSNCETCYFHSPRQHHRTDIGCAVNPSYWLEWKRRQALPSEACGGLPLARCSDYLRNPQISACSTAEKLLGLWNYQVSFVASCYQIEVLNRGGKLFGHYIVPSNNDSLFEFTIYEFSGRGRPIITIAQVARQIPNSSYRAVLSGRLDNDRLITGNLVDLDNNRGTFTMMKRD